MKLLDSNWTVQYSTWPDWESNVIWTVIVWVTVTGRAHCNCGVFEQKFQIRNVASHRLFYKLRYSITNKCTDKFTVWIVQWNYSQILYDNNSSSYYETLNHCLLQITKWPYTISVFIAWSDLYQFCLRIVQI